MKKSFKLVFTAFLLVFVALLLQGKNKEEKNFFQDEEKPLTNIRIGWQIPWATQGQITQVLKNTDILEDNGLRGEFIGFSYGGPLNEAALAGDVDVIFTADQPAASLLAKNPNWTIIGRLMYNRVSLYAPMGSPIAQVSDLQGKTVAMPFGAAAQRMALKVQEDAGLDPSTDVNNINLGIYEQSDLVRDPDVEKWGEIDAMAGFDPTPAIFEEKGLTKNLHVGKIVSVVLMSNEYIEQNPGAAEMFLQAFFDSYDYYRMNTEQANTWFKEESKLDITSKALEIAASIEPNVSAESRDDIRINFIDEDYEIMQEAADFIYDQELIDKKVNMKEYVNLEYQENLAR